jgi:hypothetical protein
MTITITTRDRFEAWLLELDDIFHTEMGISYKDFPDQLFRDFFDSGMTPEDAYYQAIESEYPGLEVDNVYTQEFDTFTDADPGL